MVHLHAAFSSTGTFNRPRLTLITKDEASKGSLETWFGKSADTQGRRQYGMSFKLLQCEVVERTGSASAKADFTTYAFDDGVKVEEKDETESSSKKVVAAKDESDDDSEDDEPVVAAKSSPKKAAAAEESEDDSEDDSDDDSEDDSEEEEKPAAKGKKPVAKQTKKVADSDDDSEEEEKPVAKAQAGKKTVKSSR